MIFLCQSMEIFAGTAISNALLGMGFVNIGSAGWLFAIHPLVTINAVLNSIATVLLIAGWIFISQGNWRAHRVAMVAACIVSAIFLGCYLTYHYLVGHVPFTGQGLIRTVYFTILISHIVLAVLVPILAIAMFSLAFSGKWAAHRRLGKITLPIWLYVSITGVIIYLLLYHIYPQPAGDPILTKSQTPAVSLVGKGGDRGSKEILP